MRRAGDTGPASAILSPTPLLQLMGLRIGRMDDRCAARLYDGEGPQRVNDGLYAGPCIGPLIGPLQNISVLPRSAKMYGPAVRRKMMLAD
jgi:hypothetical protein